jgi:hypothetical protein
VISTLYNETASFYNETARAVNDFMVSSFSSSYESPFQNDPCVKQCSLLPPALAFLCGVMLALIVVFIIRICSKRRGCLTRRVYKLPDSKKKKKDDCDIPRDV